jgi:hypothetical protein
MRKSRLLICFGLVAPLWVVPALASSQSDFVDLIRKLSLKTGRWHTTLRIVDIQLSADGSGKEIPADVRAHIQKKIGTSSETDDCIGTGTTAKGELVLPGIGISPDCTISGTEAVAPNLHLIASCGSTASGFKADTSFNATYANTSMAGSLEASVFSAQAGFTTKVILTTSSNYAGECLAS